MSDPFAARKKENRKFILSKLEHHVEFLRVIVERVHDGTIDDYLANLDQQIVSLRSKVAKDRLEELLGGK